MYGFPIEWVACITPADDGAAHAAYVDSLQQCVRDSEQVLAALKRLKLWTLLEGYRGQPRADIEAFIRAAVRFGDMFLASPEVSEFEINPVMVRAQGQGIAAVDALVVTG